MSQKKRSKEVSLTRAIVPYHSERCTALEGRVCEGAARMVLQYEVRRTGRVNLQGMPVCYGPQEALGIARGQLWGLDRERILVLYLNSQNLVVGIETAAVGAEARCAISLTALFRGAILSGAYSIIIAHNHPGGNVAPSFEDKKLLRDLKAAGLLVGCPIVDFLIVSDGEEYSDMTSIEEGKDHA